MNILCIYLVAKFDNFSTLMCGSILSTERKKCVTAILGKKFFFLLKDFFHHDSNAKQDLGQLST